MMSRRWLLPTVFVWSLSLLPARAADWPMWRHDAGRTNATPQALPRELHLHWVRQLPPADTAWPREQKMLQFDAAPQPVVMGKRLFVPSTVNDSVTAYHTETGQELWRFYAEGPVRFAPVAAKGKVYFVADDGHLYCLNAINGKLLWKLNGGPAQKSILGNHRLISMWPARGGPVLHQGKLFFTASIWPFMGIFIHAVDPDTGEILWTNSGDGTNYTIHPHGAASFGTVAPQGHLAASGDYLIAPGGRSTPAVYDLHTGKLMHFAFDKRVGGHQVMAGKQLYFVGGEAYQLVDGKNLGSQEPAALEDGTLYTVESGGSLRADKMKEIKQVTKKDKKGKDIKVSQLVLDKLYEVTLKNNAGEAALKAGPRLYTGGDGDVTAYELDEDTGDTPVISPVWKASIDGEVNHLLAADNRLFVVTSDARLYCFGASPAKTVEHSLKLKPLGKQEDHWATRAEQILQLEGADEGYCIALGIGSGRLIDELLLQSDLHVIVIDSDAADVDKFRRKMEAAGLYGHRVEAHLGAPGTFALPPYLANLIVSEEPESLNLSQTAAVLRKAYSALRPYGGLLCLDLSADQHQHLITAVQALKDKQATLSRDKGLSVLTRSGPLPESANWTHQYGDAAQTAVSKDKLVKAPLGLLWFGGPSHDKILPRHGHGPSPQVAGGRLFIEGPDVLRAMDVYTGRVLWEKELKNFGKYYNTTKHFAGAGEIGSNYVSLPDKVYAVYGDAILELDSATGTLTREFDLQAEPGKEPPHWGSIAVWEDYLIASSSPVPVEVITKPKPATKTTGKEKKEECGGKDEDELSLPLPSGPYAVGSKKLVVFNRHTGEQLWSREAEFTFRHNAIAVGGGTVFCIDNLTDERKAALKRKGILFKGEPVLYALDVATGKVQWSTKNSVFGTFLNYSAEHDLLLQAGSKYRDRAADEVDKGMIAYRGKDGKVLWQNLSITYGGPCLLWKDKILTNGLGGFAIDMKTGKATGWKYNRMYGCNTALGSEYLLTFRSGCAGFFDLDCDSGTGNLGGFRSSCTNNLIIADGVLSAPDYTRTCTCAYQNQSSLALIHMPDAEFWAFGAAAKTGQLGFNFAAPGDRRAPNGTLWQSKAKGIKFEPEQPEEFRLHSSLVEGGDLKWVAASGFVGVKRIAVAVPESKKYKVKLIFLEPQDIGVGGRIFDVLVLGKAVIKNLDVVQAAGKNHATVIREFTTSPVKGEIVIELAPTGKLPPVISGVEILEQ